MSAITEPMTELDAVNNMLDAIGHVNVTSLLPEDTNETVSKAVKRFRRTAREVQTKGWHFNTLKNYVLTPSVTTGYIQLPGNTLRVDTVREDKQTVDVVRRGQYLYDRVNHTKVFTKQLTVDIIEALEWTDLSEAAQQYIMVRAARIFAGTETVSDTIRRFTADDEAAALIALETEDAENDDRTMLQASPHVNRMRRR